MKNITNIKSCEVCDGVNLKSVLNLGLHPLCDDLVPVNRTEVCAEYPIEILYCSDCNTAHQSCQVEKKLLFPRTYHYRARFTADVLEGMADFVEMSKKQELSENSWLVDVADINTDTWDLSVNNPNRVEEVDNRTPAEIIAEIEELDEQAARALQSIKELL